MQRRNWLSNVRKSLFGFEDRFAKRQELQRRFRPRFEQMEERIVPSGFVPGSIQGQDGWTGGTVAISPNIVQGVDQTGTNAHTGVGAWLISNSTAIGGGDNGSFSSWPFSPGLAVA